MGGNEEWVSLIGNAFGSGPGSEEFKRLESPNESMRDPVGSGFAQGRHGFHCISLWLFLCG